MQHTPYRGLIESKHARGMSREELRALRRLGWLPALAGGATDSEPSVHPLGIQLADGGNALTIDMLVNPPTMIPLTMLEFVAANEQYYIEEIFNTPGITVQSGAIIYNESFPGDHFLPADQSIAPRAPGSEAPRLGSKRREYKIAYGESWAGSIEVHDEQRRWNRVTEVTDQFTRAANTFTDTLQRRGEETLADFVEASGRFVEYTDGAFDDDVPGADWAGAAPVENTTSTAPRPAAEFARVRRLFQEDKAGTLPDTLLASAEDAELFDRVYGAQAQAVLSRYGLRMRVSQRLTAGVREYVKARQVGTLAFDVPLGEPEYTREGTRKTDVYTMEVVPVFVANHAEAILEIRPAA